MTAKLGIDPGITGAIALIVGDRCLGVWDMPAVSEGKKRFVSPHLLADVLREAADLSGDDRPTVVLERVAARPGQGVSSMFSFGRSVGVIEGVVGALGWPIVRVTPATWKKRAKLQGKDKDASRSTAIDLFPEAAHWLTRKLDCGRADAMLIGYLGDEQ